MEPGFCTTCGEAVPSGSLFCGRCGARTASGQPEARADSISTSTLGVLAVAVVVIALGFGAYLYFRPSGTASLAATSAPTRAAATQTPSQAALPTAASTQLVHPAPTAAPTSTFLTFGDGTFTVGKDILPGTYRTRVASPGCYWARLSGFGGTLDDIIANDNTNGAEVVTIAASDKGFTSTRCGTWTTDLSAIVSPGSPFPDGTYIVGTDLTAGTYRSPASQGCYWARLSGFGGTLDWIIANDNTDAGAIVTIGASDKGFSSSRCGTWTKQ
jgi:hypothetical protein